MVGFSGFGGGLDFSSSLLNLDSGFDLSSGSFDLGGFDPSSTLPDAGGPELLPQPHFAPSSGSDVYSFPLDPPPLDPTKVEFRPIDNPSIFDGPNTTVPLPIDYGLPRPEIQPWQRLMLLETMDHFVSDEMPARSGFEQLRNPRAGLEFEQSRWTGQLVAQTFQPHNLKPYTGPTAPVLRNPYHALPEDVPFTPMNNGASDSSTVNGAHSHPPTFKNQPSRSDSGQTIDRQPVWSSPAPQQNRPK